MIKLSKEWWLWIGKGFQGVGKILGVDGLYVGLLVGALVMFRLALYVKKLEDGRGWKFWWEEGKINHERIMKDGDWLKKPEKNPKETNPFLSMEEEKKKGFIACYNPATFEYLGKVKVMKERDVKAAVERARVAQQIWRQTSFGERKRLLRMLLEYIVDQQETICQVACRDSGKTMVDGAFGEILTTCEKLKWTLKEGEKALATEYRSVGMIMGHKLARVEYHSLGVIGAIVSWNYPFHNVYGPMISALFAGNAFVVKVSEFTSWSAQYYEKIVKDGLQLMGYSSDLVQVITGFADAGEALVRSGIDKITFIGSPEVGKKVMAAASESLTPVVLELGGKDVAILCDDCDFSQVIDLVLRGTFQNSGQNCVGLERIVVSDKIYEKFVKTMKSKVESLTYGPSYEATFDCGALTMGERQMHTFQQLIEDAVKKGARLLVGGEPEATKKGWFFKPTLLVDVTMDMAISQKEVFGPIMVVMCSYSDEEAIRIANGCPYGLGSSVFSLNYDRAESIGSKIIAGMTNINDFGVNYLCQSLPFGGVKISGFDRFAGIEGLRGCCLMKSVTTDRFPGIRTKIPRLLQYPISHSGFLFCKALIELFYAAAWSRKFMALWHLLLLSVLGENANKYIEKDISKGDINLVTQAFKEKENKNENEKQFTQTLPKKSKVY